ncbi:glycoside hydrolase family 105 protein [Athelia psychrophila]|uniref:Glycoside hydrolase family 105 protein n=1 Tax=Athelia psychrophila TaxID=1759441 RepID=A0A166DPV1_9AGAM|nr:glycoside hydrolase family 105 protein [Fibularhizoctonia sp. CBS 109695]
MKCLSWKQGLAALCLLQSAAATAYSTQMLDSIISRQEGLGNSGAPTGQIELGILQEALQRGIETTRDPSRAHAWSAYLAQSVASSVGSIQNASADIAYPLDRLSLGNSLLHTYEASGNATALSAIDALYKSISLQPTNANGGLWYYTYQNLSYLDGMWSFAPFSTRYTMRLDPANLVASIDDVVLQLDLLWEHCHDASSGLLFHGYDAAKQRVWANPTTGASHVVWGRSVGWYMMALVDTLELLPISHQSAQWKRLHSHFAALSQAVVQAADEETGVWWQVVTAPGQEGNYLESSSAAMFVYALLKGSRLGYVDRSGTAYSGNSNYSTALLARDANATAVATATKAYTYIADHFVVREANGTLSYNNTVSVCSLNSNGTYGYYVSQPIAFNSLLGTAAFVLASLEHEAMQ